MRQRPLILLTAAVLAAHVALLAGPGMQEIWRTARITGSSPQELRFETRQIAPEPPAPPAPETPRTKAAPAAPKPAKPRPPPPKALPQKAPPEQAPDSLAVLGPTPQAAKPRTTALDGLLSGEEAVDAAPATQSDGATTTSDAQNSFDTGQPAAPVSGENSNRDEKSPASSSTSSDEPPAPVGIGSPGYNGPMPPVRVPPSAHLEFEAKGSGKGFQYSAKAQLSFKTDGLTYQARQEVSAFLVGSRSQTSTGRITPHGLSPQRFGDKARSERAAHVDVDKGQITYSGNDEPQGASAGVQDRLSIFLQLSSMIAAGPERYPPGTLIHINVTSARTTDIWTFAVDGPETLDLPAGSRQTIRLTRQPRKRYDQVAHLWVDPAMQYLPVRIRISQANGDFADLQLQSATVEKASP